MKPAAAPIATITYAAFRALLAQQPWSLWAIDSDRLEPLIAYQPVTITKLLRVLKSHYTFSDLYLFNPTSSEADIATIDWRAIPQVDATTSHAYIIARTAGQPWLGIAGSLDTAQRGDILLLLPADDETPIDV